MAFAILPHTAIVNYTKGLMLLHVPGSLALCFMMTTVKTRSVLKLSWSSRRCSTSIYHVHSKRDKGVQQVMEWKCLDGEILKYYKSSILDLFIIRLYWTLRSAASLHCYLYAHFQSILCVSSSPDLLHSVIYSLSAAASLWSNRNSLSGNKNSQRQRVCFWLLNPVSSSGHTSSSASSPWGLRPSSTTGQLCRRRQGQWYLQFPIQAQERPLGPHWQIVLVWPHERVGYCGNCIFPSNCICHMWGPLLWSQVWGPSQWCVKPNSWTLTCPVCWGCARRGLQRGQ